MPKNYYDILAVSKNATQDEIKKAYRRAAMKHHPDRGGDQSKFKEINEAYQILSNPQKRAQYDQFGTAGNNFGGGPSGGGQGFGGFREGTYSSFDFDDLFGNGGFGDIFENFFGGAFSQVQSELPITISQAVLGDIIKFKTQQGEEIALKIPSGTKEGQSFRLRGKGLPYKRGRGDLIITIRIDMPRKLSSEEKELYEKLRELEKKKHAWKFWQ